MTRYLELIAEHELQSKKEQEYWKTLRSALTEICEGFSLYLEIPSKTYKSLSGDQEYLSLSNLEPKGRKLSFTLSLLLSESKVKIPPSKFVFSGDIQSDGKVYKIAANGWPEVEVFAKGGGFDSLYPLLIAEAKKQLARRPAE